MRGVILDLASLGPADLDLSPLLGRLEAWEQHPATAPAEVAIRIAAAEVVCSNKVVLDARALAQAPRLRLVAVMATGTNNVDLAAASARGITVCNVRAYAGPSVAEHTLMLLLALARNLAAYREAVVAGDWSKSPFFCLHAQPIVELHGRRLGIVGHGDLGAAVARLATAFGMQVATAALPWGGASTGSPYPRMPLAELLGWADAVTLHCPLTPLTRNLIGREELARMRPGAFLVNTARGGIVDEAALLQALREGRLGGAALDTLEVEPPPAGNALLQARLPNLILTPHVAWASREARQRLVVQLGEVVAAFRAGQPINVVNARAPTDAVAGSVPLEPR